MNLSLYVLMLTRLKGKARTAYYYNDKDMDRVARAYANTPFGSDVGHNCRLELKRIEGINDLCYALADHYVQVR